MNTQRIWCSARDAKLKVTRRTFAAGGAEPIVTLAGYPIAWGDTSSDRGGYQVRLAKDSATFTPQVLSLWNHDFSKPLAGTANGTLRILPADDYGVPVEIDLDTATSAGRDAAAYVASGLVTGMSFSMQNGFEDFDETEKDAQTGGPVVTAKKYTVDEVTITVIPAFAAAKIGLKELRDAPNTIEPKPAGGMNDRSRDAPDRIAASHRLAALTLAFYTPDN